MGRKASPKPSRRQAVEHGRLFKELLLLLESTDEGVFGLDVEGRCTFVNRAGAAMLGYAPEELIGKNQHEMVHQKRGDRTPYPIEECPVFRASRSGEGSRSFDETLWRKNGLPFPVELSAHPLVEDGVVKGTVVTFVDLTEHMKIERRLQELDTLKNAFIRIVSHQFRTPMSAIRWNLEALLEEEFGELKPEQKKFLQVIYHANGEIITRIHDLLTALDIEENRTTFEKEEVSLESLWGSVMVQWKKWCDLKGVSCGYRPPPAALPLVKADAEKLRTAFEKLADNSVAYTPANGSVTASLEKDENALRFLISDTGIGVPKGEKTRVFTRFFRATNASAMRPDASGLGLYIAKHFIERHGGAIGFSSEEGKGSTFWFELPLR